MQGAGIVGGIVDRVDAAYRAGCDMLLVCNSRMLSARSGSLASRGRSGRGRRVEPCAGAGSAGLGDAAVRTALSRRWKRCAIDQLKCERAAEAARPKCKQRTADYLAPALALVGPGVDLDLVADADEGRNRQLETGHQAPASTPFPEVSPLTAGSVSTTSRTTLFGSSTEIALPL